MLPVLTYKLSANLGAHQATSDFTRADGTVGTVGETALSFTPRVIPANITTDNILNERSSLQECSLLDLSNINFDNFLNENLPVNRGLLLQTGDNGITTEILENDDILLRSADGDITAEAIEEESINEENISEVKTSDVASNIKALDVDRDSNVIALMRQEMNSFGISSGLDPLRRQLSNISIVDIFTA